MMLDCGWVGVWFGFIDRLGRWEGKAYIQTWDVYVPWSRKPKTSRGRAGGPVMGRQREVLAQGHVMAAAAGCRWNRRRERERRRRKGEAIVSFALAIPLTLFCSVFSAFLLGLWGGGCRE